ncbi:MAG: TrmH family RNA methyltransferase [Pseudomonadota bacterium]
MTLRLALYQPDIAENVGAAIRIAACFDAGLDVVGPCGFPLDARRVRRVAMDYRARIEPVLHSGWTAFAADAAGRGRRLVLLTTRGAERMGDFVFAPGDVVLMGRETAGAPEAVHDAAGARVIIPLAAGARSLNVAVAAGIALAEARRQLGFAPAV